MTGHPGIPTSYPHHHVRFYVFMITLVVIGVFFVLYANNDNAGTSIGSAIVGYAVRDTGAVKESPQTNFNLKKDSEVKSSAKEIPFSLSLDIIPAVDEETSVDTITLLFDKPETIIKINNDKLDLNDLEEVDFVIRGFDGQLGLEGDKLSLSGNAKEMKVNGLKFSSEEVIKISFEELDYNLLDLSGIELEDLRFTKGNGEIKAGEKLSYPLEEEEVEIIDFKGGMKIDENSNSSLLNLGGNAGGISVSGDLVDLNLW